MVFTVARVEDNEIPDPTTQSIPLYQQVARFSGNPYKFLLYLLRNPGTHLAEARGAIGLSATSQGTLQGWKNTLPGFRETLERLKQPSEDIRLVYAKAAMLDAVPDVTDAMVARAQGTSATAQRAAERILETAGVLSTGNADTPGADLSSLAMRLYANKGQTVRAAVEITNP